MPTSGERAASLTADSTAPLDAYHLAADGLRRCLDLADMAAERGNTRRAAEYLLGALDDLGPELALLASLMTPPR
jgi:hypothetical protein